MEEKRFLAIVFIGGGSSWAYGPSPSDAAKKAAKVCRQDWGVMLKLKKTLKVTVYDSINTTRWHADYDGVWDSDTGTKIPFHSTITV